MSEWKKYRLSDVCSDISYGYTASANDKEVGPKFLRITDIQGGIVNWQEVPYCEIDSKSLIKNKLSYGDIVVARTGNSTGENYIFLDDIDAVFASYLIRFRVNSEIVDPYFVWLQMRSNKWWGFIDGAKSGSAQAGANAVTLGNYKIFVPKKPIQKIISKNIHAINHKIALNQQINKTLEGMAQAVFKSWFVDFEPVRAKAAVIAAGGSAEDANLAAMQAISGKSADELALLKTTSPSEYKELHTTASLFPHSLTPSELGDIPEGWEVKTAQELYNISIGKTPPRKEAEWFTENSEDIKWISIRDMGNGKVYTGSTSEYLTKEAVKKFNIKIIPKNTVILSFKLTLGRVQISNDEICTNEAIAHFLDNEKSPNYIWTYFYLKCFDYPRLGSTSSIATAVNSQTIKNMPILVSNNNIEKSYFAITKMIFDEIRNIEKQSQTLTQIRDSLLPKLLSGEIDVSNLNIEGVW